MHLRQSANMILKLPRIIEKGDLAVSLDGDIIPSWDYSACLPFRRVPGGADAGIWPEKNRKRFNARLDTLPLWVSAQHALAARRMEQARGSRDW